MADTSIEWTDKVWNAVTGCSKISQGCKFCYANVIADRFFAKQYPPNPDGSPRKFTDVRCHEDRLEIPLKWRKPQRVFVNSMSDLFHEDVPDEFIDKVFAVMAHCERHTFQILTKRPRRMLDYMADSKPLNRVPRYFNDVMVKRLMGSAVWPGWPLPNVWLGVSVEDQKAADERIPLLLQTPAAVRWISAEPLLGPIDFDSTHESDPVTSNFLSGIEGQRVYDGRKVALDWVVCGGESGPGARPMHLSWMRSIVAQCRAAGVPVFVKQLGSVPVMDEKEWRDAPLTRVLAAKNARRAPEGTVPILMRDKKGGNMTWFPPDLQIREYPELRAEEVL